MAAVETEPPPSFSAFYFIARVRQSAVHVHHYMIVVSSFKVGAFYANVSAQVTEFWMAPNKA